MSSSAAFANDSPDVLVAPDLSDAETRRLEGLKHDIKAKFPELFPILRDLIAAGLIRGLRDIDYFGPPRPDPRNAVSAAQMALNEYRLSDEPDNISLVRTRYK